MDNNEERKTEEEYRLLAQESKEKFDMMEKKINSLDFVCKEMCGEIIHILSYIRVLESNNIRELHPTIVPIRQILINLIMDYVTVEQDIKINIEQCEQRRRGRTVSLDSMTQEAIARMFLARVSNDDDVFSA